MGNCPQSPHFPNLILDLICFAHRSNFLRVHQARLDSTLLGDYLGEGGTSDVEYWNLIRYHYVRAISFEGMNVEQGLRHFLTNAGFRLPGEAQKIDRLITVFAQCFWEDNAGTASCPFSHQDTVFILSFSVIMLNTDLHKANVNMAKKKVKKMTKQEFMNNLRGVDNSSDLSKEYLSKIYDSIASQVIEMEVRMDAERRANNASDDEGGTYGRTIYLTGRYFPSTATRILTRIIPTHASLVEVRPQVQAGGPGHGGRGGHDKGQLQGSQQGGKVRWRAPPWDGSL